MKIAVTGANGLLGQKLTQLLQQQSDVELHLLARGDNRNPPGNYSYHSVDLTDQQGLSDFFKNVKPDFVIHTAAMTQVDDCETQREACWLQNVTVVEMLVELCGKYGCFLVHLSTDFIFDGENGPYAEDAKPNPLSYYGESKLAAEKFIENSSIDWAIARTILVFGYSPTLSRGNIVLWVKNSLENKKPIQVVTDQWRMPTLAEDLAMGCWLIVKRKAKGIFNICGPDLLTPYDMAMEIADVFGLDKSLISATDGSKFTQAAKRPPKTGFDLTNSRQVLGFQPRTFREGLNVMFSD
jgi:dTDP-4-dehydrorhamnose reductase